MHDVSLILILIVVAALVFDYINGFHDTANAIATVVSTRVLTPRVAIVMAASLNFIGAIVALNVAHTIATGIISIESATNFVVLSAIIGGIIWNLITWRYGIPSSSSHALIGGLIGAALVSTGKSAILWKGILLKVIMPLVASPLLGFCIGFALMTIIYIFFSNTNPGKVSGLFSRLQILSAATMAFSHGQNDAQKSMGIITLALLSMGYIGLNPVSHQPYIPIWVILACATAMALGTSAGGWRIIKTMGHRIIRLEPVHGFAAETTAASVIITASVLGMPVSTTQVIAGSIFGVGASRRLSAVRWIVAVEMIIAWILTLPLAAGFGALSYILLKLII